MRLHGLEQERDRDLRRADGVQSPVGIELRPGRVEDADDDGADVVALLEDLADDDVRVVAVGRDDRRVRAVHPASLEDGRIHAVAEHEPALPVWARDA